MDKAHRTLSQVARSCKSLAKAVNAAIEDSTDPDYSVGYPLNSHDQVLQLLAQANDAFRVAADTLGRRTSLAGTGAVRVVAECHALGAWLAEGDSTGKALALGKREIGEELRKFEKVATGAQMPAMHSLLSIQGRIAEECERLGYANPYEAKSKGNRLPSVPDRPALFDTYLSNEAHGGYLWFQTLSTIGAHPGFIYRSLLPPELVGQDSHADVLPLERTAWLCFGYQLMAGAALGTFEFCRTSWLATDVAKCILKDIERIHAAEAQWVAYLEGDQAETNAAFRSMLEEARRLALAHDNHDSD